ncbi:hypothetical protein AWJ19_31835 [Paenibacillus sp. DMB5]|nr:hypothetical protein AWJ19_31835 [Paenibacillus sp. DMB5]
MAEDMPDLVITDIMMPGMDGIELLRNAWSNEMINRFVMLICMNEFKYAQQALEYGASGYILKLSMSMQSMQDILAKVAKGCMAKVVGTSLQAADAAPEHDFDIIYRDGNGRNSEPKNTLYIIMQMNKKDY